MLIGNEGNGVPEELARQADGAVTIPCPGPVESLNASVAASVLLYEASRQRSRRGGTGLEERAMSLFDGEPEGPTGLPRTAPLAERMRPRSLDELSGRSTWSAPASRCASKSSETIRLHDPLGSAGSGQNHPGQDHRRDHEKPASSNSPPS